MLSLPGDAHINVLHDGISVDLASEFDGARLVISLPVWTQYSTEDTSQRSIDITATVLVGRTSNPNKMRAATIVRSEDLYYTQTTPGRVRLAGHVSLAALREIEEERGDSELWFVLTGVRGIMVDKPPMRLSQGLTGPNVSVRVRGSEWAEKLEAVTDSSHIDILIPVTDDPDLAVPARRLRKARELIRRGEFDACAAELRQALDPVRAFYNTLAVHSAAWSADRKDRTEPQRYALVVQAVYNWLTTYIHDDEESIKGATMDRAAAVQAIAVVSGIVHRLARDKATEAV